jgi:ATP-dependent DNA helicase DinG
MTTVNKQGYILTTNIAAKMFKILQLTKGKALILFTSYYSMDFTYDYLAPKLKAELSIDSFKQGMESKKVLLERFSANINACLFATGSFWEGIDIKGPSLSYVIIHKLPFPVMDPVITYKLEKMKEVIGEDVQLTQMEMMLRLKQGAGRLIRDEFDKGVLVIMDIRAANKYKELIIKNLPSFKYLNNFEELKTFIAKLP